MTTFQMILFLLLLYLIAFLVLSNKNIMKKVPTLKKRLLKSVIVGILFGCIFAFISVLWEALNI